jgi:CRP/FNR family transcriptional regulator, cyclic AMP receptor protein
VRKALFILGVLNDSDIEWMIAAGKRQTIPSGKLLIEEGRPTAFVSIVLDGAFSVRASGLEGKEIAELRAGEIVGEISFVDSRPPSASVVALEDSLVLSIPVASLRAKLEDPLFAARFYRALAVFLANRLRVNVARLGYGKVASARQPESAEEIGPTALETLSVAGARLDWMIRRLRGE